MAEIESKGCVNQTSKGKPFENGLCPFRTEGEWQEHAGKDDDAHGHEAANAFACDGPEHDDRAEGGESGTE